MARPIATPLKHSAYRLVLREEPALFLDVLRFDGEEPLSRPFKYRIEFTCTEQDLPSERLLNREASFLIFPAPHSVPRLDPAGLPTPATEPLRTVYGVVTGLQRLSASVDEARYALTLEPHLALAGHGQQHRLYQHKSVPEIVDHILRSRHGFRGQDLFFNLIHEYPRRKQVLQYGESDLAFIERLLAEVGIWYRFTSDDRLFIEVVNFHDNQKFYAKGPTLPHRPPGGLSSDQDSVWNLQTRHRVVEQQISIRSYNAEDIHARLDAEVNKARKLTSTYGDAYHYAEPYTELGKPLDWDWQIPCESGEFFARIRHEQYLNGQTILAGASTCPTLGPAQMLTLEGKVPQAFEPKCVITRVVLKAARDQSLVIDFDAIPCSEDLCLRPPFLPKPQIAGTLAARITSNKADPVYARLDLQGRYRVRFLFDRDTWEKGCESMWLRLARPYAGATHGLHLPLIAGTEVAIAFEQGDPDRPYIAHALHDNKHPDPVTRDNQQRNVLRTPANNKLRMDDTRGQEHVKLSTDYGGKSQLNLGYMTAGKVHGVYQKRGDGFELRSDSYGAIRAGAGIFISADKQAKALGEALEMKEAIAQLEEAVSRVKLLAGNAHLANTSGADTTVPEQLKAALSQLKEAGILVSAPAGMALVTPQHLQLSAGQTLSVVGRNADLSILKRFSVAAGSAINLFAQRLGIKLIANKGPVSLQAQNDRMELLARSALDITSTEDEIRITAKKKITLNAGSNYITIDPYRIEIGSPGEVEIKAPYFIHTPGAARLNTALTPLADPLADTPNQLKLHFLDGDSRPVAHAPYKVRFSNGQVLEGQLDEQGRALHSPVPEHTAQVEYLFPTPERGPDWAPHSRIAAAMGEAIPRADLSGPGKWVTENTDYHGARNLGQMLLNRLISMGDEGRAYGSEGKDYERTKRTVTQVWQRLGEDEQRFAKTSAGYRYGEQRQITQTYLQGPDEWSTTGKSWYWQPGVASTVYEDKEAGQ